MGLIFGLLATGDGEMETHSGGTGGGLGHFGL